MITQFLAQEKAARKAAFSCARKPRKTRCAQVSLPQADVSATSV
jgi:hypothetical protein